MEYPRQSFDEVVVLDDKQDGSEGFDEVVVLECNTDACNTKAVSSYPRVPIHVQECTVIVTLALFEREVVKLLKVSANQLLDKNIELANEGSFPDELKALLNQKFAFKIAIGSFNIKNKSDGYSVSKLTENPLVISVLDKKFDDIQPVDVDGHVGYPWHYSLVVSWGWDKAYDH
ncbi:hypothetical protein HanPSC8_Chr09g0352381 [Helianthus annuus]|nr:hypothetical protein HanPSC8_Chr09g0352381 [Helianthus annuus]